jgi:hypothetical protein
MIHRHWSRTPLSKVIDGHQATRLVVQVRHSSQQAPAFRFVEPPAFVLVAGVARAIGRRPVAEAHPVTDHHPFVRQKCFAQKHLGGV